MISPQARWPAPVRALAAASSAGVAAAHAGDAQTFEASVGRLATLDPESVRLVLGSIVRALLEDLHPDGLDAGDLQDVVRRCVRSTAAWPIVVDPQVLLLVLAGALGIHPDAAQPEARPGAAPFDDPFDDPADDPVAALGPPDVARHALLLTADLLTAADDDLAPYFDAALADIRVAETVESP